MLLGEQIMRIIPGIQVTELQIVRDLLLVLEKTNLGIGLFA